MVARPGVLVAVAIGAALVLAGCSGYDGNETAELGETLTFSITADRKTEMQLTVADIEKASAADAEGWGFDSTSDVYFVQYSADRSTAWSDWAVVTEGDNVVRAEGPRMFPDPSIPDEVCNTDQESDAPCVIFVVPAGDTVDSVRYYGVDTGYHRGGGVGTPEWVTWSVV